MPKLSSKNRVTIPVEAIRSAGLQPGDELRVRASGPGRIEIERAEDLIKRFAGSLTGAYPEGYLEDLRNEWEK